MKDERRISPGELLWGRYKIEKLLGEGGMGQVWAAFDKKLKRPVAIKIIRRKYADHPEYAARFQREAQAVAGLKHRNIVGVHDADEAPDGRLYMVMERIAGVTVRQLIDGSKRVDVVTSIHVAIQVAAALGAAHAVNLWHRDIKPENIMVSTKGDVWVLDFGIAVQGRSQDEPALIKRGKRRGTGRLGTVGYMPPEEAMNQTADRRGDFYALGVVLYEMIAGQKPYPDVDEQNETEMLAAHAFSEPRPLMEMVPDCPEWIWPIVARLLAKDPDERYDDEEELIVDLRAGLRESVPPGHPFARKIDQDRHEKAREKAFAKRGSLSSIPGEGAAPADAAPARSPSSPEPALGGWASTGPVAEKPEASSPSAANETRELAPGIVPSSPNTPRWLSPERAAVEVTGPLPEDFMPSVPASAPPFMQAPPAVAAPAAQQATTELPEAPPEAWIPPFKLSPPAVPPLLPPSVRAPAVPASAAAPTNVSAPASPASVPAASTPAPAVPASAPAVASLKAPSPSTADAAPMAPDGAGEVEPSRAGRGVSALLQGLDEVPTGRLVLRSFALGIALAAVVAVVFRHRLGVPSAWKDGAVVVSASVSALAPPASVRPASVATADPSVAVDPAPAAAVSTVASPPKPAKPPPGPAKSARSVPTVMIGGKAVPADKVPLFERRPVF